ncbi:Methionyl-tRNA synthetase [[Mycoplasma] cavipharyngis]|uniref:methionine--tRNA ligase n=1 Tax=[Mycoplasma] cavipharyngis TaxID=92757 RepID=UPI0037044749
MPKVYITTPIYYPSDQPHIGHLYSTYFASALKDYYSLIGYDAYFLTGTDEHGQKIVQAAAQANLDPLTYVNQYVAVFKKLWKQMDLNYDQFIRTTDHKHQKIVQKIFQKLQNLNLIYLDTWKGWYCISCEENYTPSQALKNDDILTCEHGHQLIERNEPSYFLKISQFQHWLQDYYHQVDFLFPNSRKKELLNNFINNNLEDLSVSRTKLNWGISVLSDPEHVIYVWIDALCNYLSALGYLSDDDQLFQKYWNDPTTKIIHVTAKEISRFHAIYWPIILKCLNLRLFNKLIAHGWILMNHKKMSKSLKNTIDPIFLANHFSHDGIRHYLLSFNLAEDNNFSYHDLISNYNTHLVNLYGNLISRIVGMFKKYYNYQVPDFDQIVFSPEVAWLNQMIDDFLKNLTNLVENDNLKIIIENISKLIIDGNKLIETLKPWDLVRKNENQKLQSLLFVLYKLAVVTTFAYQPVLKDSSQKAKLILGIDQKDLTIDWLLNQNNWKNLVIDQNITPILYQRLPLNYFEQYDYEAN